MKLEQVILRGTAGSRPAAATVPVGTLYFSTDTQVLERSTGSAWESYSSAAATGDVTGPGSALDQAIAVFDGSTGKVIQDSGVLLTALATLPIAESDVTNLTTDLAAKAPLASPALTGVPTVPTASVGTNTTQAASTAFVIANAAAGSGDVVGPASATNNALALFDGTTGKLLKDSATLLSSLTPFDPAADRTITGDWIFKQDDATAMHRPIQIQGPSGAVVLDLRVYNNDSWLLDFKSIVGTERVNILNKFVFENGGNFLGLAASQAVYFSSTSDPLGANDVGFAQISPGLAPGVLRIRNSSGVGGGICIGELAASRAKPSASSGYRGTLWITWGTTGVADIVEVCAKDAADAYAWKPVASVASASTTFTGQFGPALYDAGNSGSSKTIDFNNGNDQYLTLTGNAALTFSNPVSGFRYALVVNTGAGSFTPTFPGTVSWLDAVPTLPTTASKLYVVVLLYLGNVTKYLASFSKEP